MDIVYESDKRSRFLFLSELVSKKTRVYSELFPISEGCTSFKAQDDHLELHIRVNSTWYLPSSALNYKYTYILRGIVK